MLRVNFCGYFFRIQGACVFNMYELLIKKIKEKKPLNNLDDSLIEEKIINFLKLNPKINKSLDLNNEKNKEFIKILKSIRNNLNKHYGIFWLSNTISLESHKSTKERLNFYPELYRKIFALTGKPKTILDISSGLNPLSFEFTNLPKSTKYIATELSKQDCEILNNFFQKNQINGEAIQIDLTKTQSFPKADVVFLFKVFDSVEEKGHKLAELIINNLKANYAVISFATITTKNQKMNFPNRGWIERLLERLKLTYKKLNFGNEVFYIVKLKQGL